LKAVLFKSEERFCSFQNRLDEYGIDYTILDFANDKWIEFDYQNYDFIIYFPSFKYSSNHPLSLHEVYDNIMFIYSRNPGIKIFPDPNIVKYYNDKYKQFLFLKGHGYPIPETIPLFSEESVELADRKLGYPMIVKNRYGAGGDYVFRLTNKEELTDVYNLSRLNLFNLASVKYFARILSKKLFYYRLIKEKRAPYPFLSPPLLAQEFIKIDRDLKTVTMESRVVEGHWRFPANKSMWKVNIDGGGIGVWSNIPEEAIRLSVELAKELATNWLNVDLIIKNEKFLITEFSPIWHHYAYKEKANFIYENDYNIEVPLKESLDLERMVIKSMIDLVEASKRDANCLEGLGKMEGAGGNARG
jgi:hypothetical protein